MDGCTDVKAVLRIAYSNQKFHKTENLDRIVWSWNDEKNKLDKLLSNLKKIKLQLCAITLYSRLVISFIKEEIKILSHKMAQLFKKLLIIIR